MQVYNLLVPLMAENSWMDMSSVVAKENNLAKTILKGINMPQVLPQENNIARSTNRKLWCP